MKTAKTISVLSLAAVLLAVAATQAYRLSYDATVARAQDDARATLLLVVEALDQTVGRFEPLATLIAGDPDVREMLIQNAPEGYGPFMNEKLRQIALSLGASEIYVMDTDGLTVAASNYRDDDSFLGRNFAFRPYFIQSLAGKAATFHALGTTSGERGFFYSAPVLDGIDVVGVLAVKITVGEIEQDWPSARHEILIADANGIVFLTSREDYKYRALAPLPVPVRETIASTLQYPIERVTPLGLSADVIGPETVQVTIDDAGRTDLYLAASMPLDLAGWHAIALTSLTPVQAQVIRTIALGGFALVAAVLAVLVILQRRENILQRIRFEQEQRAVLETRVRERTADLDAANTTLRAEVAERRLAEERLKRSQRELVQAGKLAALGQMSAAISHEINQPLAAIKSYAGNAAEFLTRGRQDDARENIKHISAMSDRMAEISRHLRNFARQPGEALKPINVTEVISETIALMGPQLRAENAEVRFAGTAPVWALGGKLRLQQVLVNIIKNALEAMKAQTSPLVEVSVTATQDAVRITLRDHGPGVRPEVMDQVFDAFYTTKEAGAGMGLGMSISQNIISDFGGSLLAENHPDRGAVFTVVLQPKMADQIEEAQA